MSAYENIEAIACANTNFEIVVAIDLGTSQSGYAYSYKFEKDKILVNPNLNSSCNLWQVPTSILFNENEEFVAFGIEAEDEYSELAEEGNAQNCYYFHHFKMMLHDKVINRQLMLTSETGKSMKALKVFTESIRYLKDHFLEKLAHRNNRNTTTVSDIRWVITVPAIWNNAAKQFMREAAVKAGIPNTCLLIALEPECAALYALTLPDIELDVSVGQKYGLLDCGGGTIDSTIHEIVATCKVKELMKPTGGPWGSNLVNKLFIEFLKKKLSKDVIDQFISMYPTEWVELLREFEKIKKSIKTDKGDQSFTLFIGLQEIYKQVKGTDITHDFHHKNNNFLGIQIQGNRRFKIPNKTICDFIKTVSKYTTTHVKNLLKEQNNLNSIIMVGGFSSCNILKDFIKDEFNHLHVFIPDEPDITVVKGAVIFGWNTAVIQSRRSQKTYGRAIVVKPFKPGMHPERHKVECDGIIYCDNVFQTLVTVNDEIPVGKVIKVIGTPPSKDLTSVAQRIFASPNEHVEYTDDPDVELIGVVDIPMPDTTGGRNREVHIEYYFGLTELKITALDVTSGSKVELVCDFLSY